MFSHTSDTYNWRYANRKIHTSAIILKPYLLFDALVIVIAIKEMSDERFLLRFYVQNS